MVKRTKLATLSKTPTTSNNAVLSSIDLKGYNVTNVFTFLGAGEVSIEALDQILFNMLNHSVMIEAIEVAELVSECKKHRVDITKSQILPSLANHLMQQEISFEKNKNTKQQLASNIKGWLKWCLDENEISFPAGPESIIRFFNDKKDEHKVSTLKSYIWAIKRLHIAGGLNDPFQAKMVKKAIASVIEYRQVELKDSPEQTRALRKEHLKALYHNYKVIERTPIVVRNMLISLLAYDTLLRESELARVSIEDIIEEGELYYIRVSVTKSKKGVDQYRPISSITNQVLNEYLECTERTRSTRGPLLLKHLKNGKLSEVSKLVVQKGIKAINIRSRKEIKNDRFLASDFISAGTIYNALVSASDILIAYGFEPREVMLSGHSGRVGKAKDLRKSGMDTKDIQAAGGWSTIQMVVHYTQDSKQTHAAMFEEHSALTDYLDIE
ncbi:tyrosine-type recombinase/integrase [Vibrio alginolyticus]|uniref:tyrosine-type recombinase/integrase n=1 Tax=Vibrio alginolyticus TaxID=663 RepID=UPI0015F45FB0|nr:tyrosine-type recombinase/integrase [Vibrio alginolyticus]